MRFVGGDVTSIPELTSGSTLKVKSFVPQTLDLSGRFIRMEMLYKA